MHIHTHTHYIMFCYAPVLTLYCDLTRVRALVYVRTRVIGMRSMHAS